MSVDPTRASIVSNELVGTSPGTISGKFQKASTFSHKTHTGEGGTNSLVAPPPPWRDGALPRLVLGWECAVYVYLGFDSSAVLSTTTSGRAPCSAHRLAFAQRRLSVDRVRVAVDPLVQQAHPAAVSQHRHGGGDSLPAPRCDWCIGKVFAGHDRRRWWRWPLDGVPVGRYLSRRRAGRALLPTHHARHVGRRNLVTENKWVLEMALQRVQR